MSQNYTDLKLSNMRKEMKQLKLEDCAFVCGEKKIKRKKPNTQHKKKASQTQS